jgi:hypothetical protein
VRQGGRGLGEGTKPGAMTPTWIQLTSELLSWPMMFLVRLVPSSVLMVCCAYGVWG